MLYFTRSIVLCTWLMAAAASASLIPDQWLASAASAVAHANEPKHGTFDRWEMQGLYLIHTRRRGHGGEDQDEAGTQGTDLWWFRKVYDESQEAARIDAYPLNLPGQDLLSDTLLEDLSSSGVQWHKYKRPDAAFVMIVREDGTYLLEEDKDEGKHGQYEEVDCQHLPNLKWKRFNPLQGAHFEALTFEDNRLCHKYTDLSIDTMKHTKVTAQWF